MSHLSKLKLVAASPKRTISPVDHRRKKLIEKIDEQIALRNGEEKGVPYSRKKRVWVTDDEGRRVRVEREAQIRKWWWQDDEGTAFLQLRYGASPIELRSGSPVVEVGALSKLGEVLKSLRAAVEAGELDEVLTKAARRPKQR